MITKIGAVKAFASLVGLKNISRLLLPIVHFMCDTEPGVSALASPHTVEYRTVVLEHS